MLKMVLIYIANSWNQFLCDCLCDPLPVKCLLKISLKTIKKTIGNSLQLPKVILIHLQDGLPTDGSQPWKCSYNDDEMALHLEYSCFNTVVCVSAHKIGLRHNKNAVIVTKCRQLMWPGTACKKNHFHEPHCCTDTWLLTYNDDLLTFLLWFCVYHQVQWKGVMFWPPLQPNVTVRCTQSHQQ